MSARYEDPAPGPIVDELCDALEAHVDTLAHDTSADLEALCDVSPETARKVIAVLHGDTITPDTVGNDPNSTYLRIFELVCRAPRHEARRLIRALDDDLVAALADRLAVTAQFIHEETHT